MRGEYRDHPLPTTHVMGKLSLKVVEARGLRVGTSQNVKPYVLLQVSGMTITQHLHGLVRRRADVACLWLSFVVSSMIEQSEWVSALRSALQDIVLTGSPS